MIRYKVRYEQPHRHFISFEARIPVEGKEKVQLQLAAWRPGRYELGNFSKNIRAFEVTDELSNPLPIQKLTKDLWEADCEGLQHVILSYEYYAADLNAGSTFLDERLLYINPVNCFFFLPDQPDIDYEVVLDIPDNYVLACGLNTIRKNVLSAKSFDELADSPLIASAAIRHLQYQLGKYVFHIWIEGEVNLDEARLVNEFVAFTDAQLILFGDIPCNDYHFLFLFSPDFIRHGVEHSNSTVIAMGPAADFQNEPLFKDLLGISCHELFHTWNVKNIRPVEMLPYDFTKENYSRLGYVYEGVTTYYGDLLLWRSGSFNDLDWLNAVEDRLQKHFENPGRFNLSVADSSYDTWLDGYSSGIPWRKVSIYNEGFLIAMICDIIILHNSEGKYSMDDVMRVLYNDFGKKGLGYSESDYFNSVKRFSGDVANEIFDELVNGTDDYMSWINTVLEIVGLTLSQIPAYKWNESAFGLKVDENNGKVTVSTVMPDSPADHGGLWEGDEIISVDGTAPYKNFQWLLKMSKETVDLKIFRRGKMLDIKLSEVGITWEKKYRVITLDAPTEDQVRFFNLWKSRS